MQNRHQCIVGAAGILLLMGGCLGRETPAQREWNGQILQLIKPVKLNDCTIKRFGSDGDGGYLACSEAPVPVEGVYSYGIQGRDELGCDVATHLNAQLFQFDPFDRRAPNCEAVTPRFFTEGVGDKKFIDSSKRKFDTIESHIKQNGQTGKVLFLKMDVEGAEWESLAVTPDPILDQFQQIVLEIHWLVNMKNDKIKPVLSRLKSMFHIVHVHANDGTCLPGWSIPSDVMEVTYANKRFFKGETTDLPEIPHRLDQANGNFFGDCPLRLAHFGF